MVLSPAGGALGKMLPTFAVRLALGSEMAEALLLSSARVSPQRLLKSGYSFRQPDLEDALRHVLGRAPSHLTG